MSIPPSRASTSSTFGFSSFFGASLLAVSSAHETIASTKVNKLQRSCNDELIHSLTTTNNGNRGRSSSTTTEGEDQGLNVVLEETSEQSRPVWGNLVVTCVQQSVDVVGGDLSSSIIQGQSSQTGDEFVLSRLLDESLPFHFIVDLLTLVPTQSSAISNQIKPEKTNNKAETNSDRSFGVVL